MIDQPKKTAYTTPEQERFAAAVRRVTDETFELLVAKNLAYGNSALDPIRVFSKADPTEQLLVRIDDKLSRLKYGQGKEGEDVVSDLIGYLVLLKVQRASESKTENPGSRSAPVPPFELENRVAESLRGGTMIPSDLVGDQKIADTIGAVPNGYRPR